MPAAAQRYWLWAKRQNQTFRPSRTLTDEEEELPVGEIRDSGVTTRSYQSTELKLFLEVTGGGPPGGGAAGGNGAPRCGEPPYGGGPAPAPSPIPSDTILLFFKLYAPASKSIEYVGHLFVPTGGVFGSIVPHLLRMGGFGPGVELLIFEEIKFEPVMCEVVDVHSSFAKCQLENGDIVCFQEAIPRDGAVAEYPTVPSFMEYTSNKLDVRFRRLEDARRGAQEADSDVVIELGKGFSYDQIVAALAARLGLADPDLLRLSPHDTYTQQPKAAVKHRGVERLSDLLVHYAQTTDLVYYEILEMPLPKLERMRVVSVDFFARGQIAAHQVQVPIDDDAFTMLSLERALADKLVPERAVPVERLRLVDVYHSKIRRIFEAGDRVSDIVDGSLNLRLEEVPAADMAMTGADRLVHCYHVANLPEAPPPPQDDGVADMETATPGNEGGVSAAESTGSVAAIHVHGDPLLVVVRPGDTLRELRATVQERLNVPDQDFEAWRFHVVTESPAGAAAEPIDDGADLSRRFSAWMTADGVAAMYIGMEHSAAKGPHRSQTCQVNSSSRHTHERPVRIYT